MGECGFRCADEAPRWVMVHRPGYAGPSRPTCCVLPRQAPLGYARDEGGTVSPGAPRSNRGLRVMSWAKSPLASGMTGAPQEQTAAEHRAQGRWGTGWQNRTGVGCYPNRYITPDRGKSRKKDSPRRHGVHGGRKTSRARQDAKDVGTLNVGRRTWKREILAMMRRARRRGKRERKVSHEQPRRDHERGERQGEVDHQGTKTQKGAAIQLVSLSAGQPVSEASGERRVAKGVSTSGAKCWVRSSE